MLDPLSLRTITPEDQSLRKDIELILTAGLRAADPYRCVKDAIQVHQSQLILQGSSHKLDLNNGIACIAVGKAAWPMLAAAVDTLGEMAIGGICVSKTAGEVDRWQGGFQLICGGHPHPTETSIFAGEAVLKAIRTLPAGIPVLWLISGGGSALLTLPFEGISLADYATLNRLMLANNLTIDQVNTIRKHIDWVKGGRLLREMGDRPGAALILSDVVSGDLSTIASGITSPDWSTYADAIQVLKEADIWDEVPVSIQNHLDKGNQGGCAVTLRDDEFKQMRFSNRIVGSVRQSLAAMVEQAREQGWKVEIREPLIQHDIDQEAIRILADIRSATGGRRCLIYGGEGTVQLTGSGRGGRNSHLAALLARGIAGRDEHCTIVTFASDGDDGNSGAAGAIVDGKTYTRAYQSLYHFGYDIENSDTGRLFQDLGDAIVTGLTGTNVNDWVLVFQH